MSIKHVVEHVLGLGNMKSISTTSWMHEELNGTPVTNIRDRQGRHVNNVEHIS